MNSLSPVLGLWVVEDIFQGVKVSDENVLEAKQFCLQKSVPDEMNPLSNFMIYDIMLLLSYLNFLCHI